MEGWSFREAVRKRPGMYIGDVRDGSGANHIVFEIVANTLDQFLANKASRCELFVDGYEIVIVDDGPGLPFRAKADHSSASEAEYCFENPHFGPTAHEHAPHVHLVHTGAGLAAVNALSSKIEVSSWDGQYEWSQSYRCGLPIRQSTLSESTAPSGTRIKLDLDEAIFCSPPDLSILCSTLREQTHLYPDFNIVLNGSTFSADRGLLSLAKSLHQDETHPELWHRKKYSDFWIDLALVGTSAEPFVARSWANGVLTRRGGTHQRALECALTKLNWNPAVSLVHVIMGQPEFAGPFGDALHAPHLELSLEIAFSEIIGAALGTDRGGQA